VSVSFLSRGTARFREKNLFSLAFSYHSLSPGTDNSYPRIVSRREKPPKGNDVAADVHFHISPGLGIVTAHDNRHCWVCSIVAIADDHIERLRVMRSRLPIGLAGFYGG